MSTSQSLFEGVVVLITIIALAIVLKRLGILQKELSTTFSQLVLYITLPAVIFSSLALQKFDSTFLIMSLIMALIEIGLLLIAWLFATLFKFSRGKKGALMLVSAFGMTAFLGYPIIQEAFPGNATAMEEAVITSEIGVGLLLFILGPLIAMYFGNKNVDGKALLSTSKKFFTSPIFFAIIAGIGMSFVPFNREATGFHILFNLLRILGNANMLLVAFTIGLIFEFKRMQSTLLFIGLAIMLKLFLKPILSLWFTDIGVFTEMMRQIVFIETALPSAILTAVYAKQYDCEPELVSGTIMISLVVSIGSLAALFLIFF